MRILLGFALISLCHPSLSAEIYKCEKDGRPVFSDQPCGPEATTVQLKEQPAIFNTDGGENSADGALLTAQAEHASAQRKIKEHERKIAKHQRDLDNELSALRRSKSFSTNSLAGATRDVSISNEMTAVTEKYKALIAAEQGHIDSLSQKLRSIQAN